MGSRAICRRAQEQQFFVQAINGLAGGSLVPAAVLPTTIRRDYVANANDSYWLPNARHPLTPTARIVGETAVAQGFRSRMQLDQIGRASCRERVCQYV